MEIDLKWSEESFGIPRVFYYSSAIHVIYTKPLNVIGIVLGGIGIGKFS